jgi:hypothetical protein
MNSLSPKSQQKLAKNSNFLTQIQQKHKTVCELSTTMNKNQIFSTLLIKNNKGKRFERKIEVLNWVE